MYAVRIRPRGGRQRHFQDRRDAVWLPMRGQAHGRPRVSRFCRLPASRIPLPGRDVRPRPRPFGRASALFVPHLPAGARLKRAPSSIPFRAADGQVRPSNWTLPHGSPDLCSLWARRMAVRRHAAGIGRTTAGRVALRELQLAASDRAGRHVPGAVRDLPRNEPGTPVCRLDYMLELRRGFARCVSRQGADVPERERAGGKTGTCGDLMSHPGRVISAEMAPSPRSSGPVARVQPGPVPTCRR